MKRNVSVAAGLSYVELGTLIPESGAEYAYWNNGLGPFAGYLCSWLQTFVIRPTSVGVICLGWKGDIQEWMSNQDIWAESKQYFF